MVSKAESYEREFFDRTFRFVKQSLIPSETPDAFSSLNSAKVAIVADQEALQTVNGQHMVSLSANLLSRFCRSIDLIMPDKIQNRLKLPILRSDNLTDSLKDLCHRINPYGIFRANPTQPRSYDGSLVIGSGKAPQNHPTFINSDGWVAYVGTECKILSTRTNENPIGAQLAASLGAAEVFKAIFHGIAGVQEKFTRRLTSLFYSPLNNIPNEIPEENPQLPSKLDLDTVHLVGAGAIGCPVAYMMASIPGLSGRIIVTDPQNLEISNLNRLPLALSTDVGEKKVEVIKRISTGNLEILTHSQTFQEYVEDVNPSYLDLVADTVDDVQTHWFVQRTFPRVLLNGGTMVEDVNLVRIDDFLRKSCLGCIYPRAKDPDVAGIPYATISFISMMAGILLAVETLKERVYSLRKYRLDNMLIFNGLDMRRMHRKITRTDKLDSCGVDCKRKELIAQYRKAKLRGQLMRSL